MKSLDLLLAPYRGAKVVAQHSPALTAALARARREREEQVPKQRHSA